MRRGAATHFFSEPMASLREVYCPFSVLCRARQSRTRPPHSAHDEPPQHRERAALRALRVRDRREQRGPLRPVRCAHTSARGPGRAGRRGSPGNSVSETGERMNGGAVIELRSPENDAILHARQCGDGGGGAGSRLDERRPAPALCCAPATGRRQLLQDRARAGGLTCWHRARLFLVVSGSGSACAGAGAGHGGGVGERVRVVGCGAVRAVHMRTRVPARLCYVMDYIERMHVFSFGAGQCPVGTPGGASASRRIWATASAIVTGQTLLTFVKKALSRMCKAPLPALRGVYI